MKDIVEFIGWPAIGFSIVYLLLESVSFVYNLQPRRSREKMVDDLFLGASVRLSMYTGLLDHVPYNSLIEKIFNAVRVFCFAVIVIFIKIYWAIPLIWCLPILIIRGIGRFLFSQTYIRNNKAALRWFIDTYEFKKLDYGFSVLKIEKGGYDSLFYLVDKHNYRFFSMAEDEAKVLVNEGLGNILLLTLTTRQNSRKLEIQMLATSASEFAKSVIDRQQYMFGDLFRSN